jgi:hypothetical protein
LASLRSVAQLDLIGKLCCKLIRQGMRACQKGRKGLY